MSDKPNKTLTLVMFAAMLGISLGMIAVGLWGLTRQTKPEPKPFYPVYPCCLNGVPVLKFRDPGSGQVFYTTRVTKDCQPNDLDCSAFALEAK